MKALRDYLSSRFFLADLAIVFIGGLSFWSLGEVVWGISTFFPMPVRSLIGILAEVLFLIGVPWALWFSRQFRRLYEAFGIEISIKRAGSDFFSWPSMRRSILARNWNRNAAVASGFSLGMFLILCWVAVHATYASWHNKLEALTLEIRSKGWPVGLAEFQQDLPDARYAYPALTEVLAAFDAISTKDLSTPLLQIGRRDRHDMLVWRDDSVHAERLIREVLAPLLARSSRLMKVDYLWVSKHPSEWRDQKDFPKLTRTAARISLCAVSRAFDGDDKRAWEDVRLLHKTGHLFHRDPQLIAKDEALWVYYFTVAAAINVMLTNRNLSLPQDVIVGLRGMNSESLAADAMKEQIAWWLDLRDFYSEQARTKSFFSPASTRARTGVYDRNSLLACRALSQLASIQSWAEVPIGLAQFDKAFGTLMGWPYDFSLGPMVIVPGSWNRVFQREWELRNWTKMAFLISAANNFRLRYGRYPITLNKLVPHFAESTDTQDVFVDHQFEYTQTDGGQGFFLCSPGAHGDRRSELGDQEFCVHQQR